MKITDTHSGTFGCPDTQATTSQPKKPSFFLSHNDVENFYWTFFVHDNLMFNFGQI